MEMYELYAGRVVVKEKLENSKSFWVFVVRRLKVNQISYLGIGGNRNAWVVITSPQSLDPVFYIFAISFERYNCLGTDRGQIKVLVSACSKLS